MPLVRCPTHKIPYNDENPRGCPACAREKEGAAQVSVAQPCLVAENVWPVCDSGWSAVQRPRWDGLTGDRILLRGLSMRIIQ